MCASWDDAQWARYEKVKVVVQERKHIMYKLHPLSFQVLRCRHKSCHFIGVPKLCPSSWDITLMLQSFMIVPCKPILEHQGGT